MVLLKEFFQKVDFEKFQQKHAKLPSRQTVNVFTDPTLKAHNKLDWLRSFPCVDEKRIQRSKFALCQ